MAYTSYTKSTFSPTLQGATVGGTTTYSVQQGYCTVIGDLVVINFFLSGTGATGTGIAQIGNFPFTSTSDTNFNAVNAVFMANNAAWTWVASSTHADLKITAANNFAVIRCIGSGVTGLALQMANAAFQFQGTIAYFI